MEGVVRSSMHGGDDGVEHALFISMGLVAYPLDILRVGVIYSCFMTYQLNRP